MLTIHLESMQLKINALRSQTTTGSPGPLSIEFLQMVKELTIFKLELFSSSD